MSFRRFSYHPDAEEGLATLVARGDETVTVLKDAIRIVQKTWEPQDDDEPQLIVPLADFFLIFTVAKEDSSMLVLAGVEPQPETGL